MISGIVPIDPVEAAGMDRVSLRAPLAAVAELRPQGNVGTLVVLLDRIDEAEARARKPA